VKLTLAALLLFFATRAWCRIVRQTDRMRDNAARRRTDNNFWDHVRREMRADHE